MKKRKQPETRACDVCGAPLVLVQSHDAVWGAPAGTGYGAYKQTCECWHCTGCGQKGRGNDPRCNCLPCPLCSQPVAPGSEHDCDEVPF
jgi:hypothetical protein